MSDDARFPLPLPGEPRGMPGYGDLGQPAIPRRELVTLLAYLETGSHKGAAHRLGISESTARQRVSATIQRLGVRNAAQAVWTLRYELERETVDGNRERSSHSRTDEGFYGMKEADC